VLRWRLISTAVLLTAIVLACWLDFNHNFGHVGVWLAPFCIALTVLACYEVLELFRSREFRPLGWAVYVGSVTVVLVACLPMVWSEFSQHSPVPPVACVLLALVLAVGLVLVGEMIRYEKPGGVMVHVGLATFAICYVGLSMAFVAMVRLIGGNQEGMAALLSLIVVAKVSDIGAYGCGRLLGRHKLVPRLSPGKTIEGAIGGVAAACLGSFVMFQFVVPALAEGGSSCPWWRWLAYGVILAVAAMVGDLAASLLKRDMDQKDSGNLVPGLGGVLDLLDSLMFAAPVAYACWGLGLVSV
jgi:phosphatidate cytidylyltransferase